MNRRILRRDTPGRRWAVAMSAIVIAIVLTQFAGFAPAQADEDAAGTITWAVSPADADSTDQRSWIELQLDPGATVQEHLAVRNLSDQSVRFRLTAADGYFTDSGRFNMLPSDATSVAAGTWISVQDTVTVEAGDTAIVPFSVTVPELAEPGDHAAGIAASVFSAKSEAEGKAVGVESRVGFRVMTRVTGELAPAVVVERIQTSYDYSWNPLAPGTATVTFDVVNAGNVRLVAGGTVEVAGNTIAFPRAGEVKQELLPGESRTLTTIVRSVWPVVYLAGDVTVDAELIASDGADTTQIAPVTSTFALWAAPWPQLVLLLALALILFAIVGNRLRGRRKLASLLRDARDEGKRAAEEERILRNEGDRRARGPKDAAPGTQWCVDQ